MLVCEEIRHYLIILAECPNLKPKDRWLLFFKAFPEYKEYCEFDWIEKLKLSKKVINHFETFKQSIQLDKILTAYNKLQVNYFSFFDDVYPESLKQIYCPPLLLYYRGNVDLLNRCKLSVVGPRKHSEYSNQVIDEILPAVIKRDIVLVSGLARGVDTLVHKCAVDHYGHTIGVIGSGVCIAYPAENANLQKYMCQHQLVLSEYPPLAKPKKHHFPERNRIIAGLSRGLLVTEARKRSGTLITARIALDEGRDIFAVPGPILTPLSEGTNELIHAGAIPLASPKQLFEEWSV